MPSDFDLIVRRTARYDIALRAKAGPTQLHAAAIRLSATVAARNGLVDVDVLDFSGGGVGLLSMVFFPRRSCLRLVVQGFVDGEPDLLDAVVRVQRVVMSDRRPAYIIGTSFESLSTAAQAQVDQLLARLEGGSDVSPTSAEQSP
ncbi:MAG: hypothetical protein AMXMBFR58_34720 [Phycisphaerae bacterium]|nr:hypothetical protein [Phycisphaerales bacterium]MCK6475630.1 PilZ domain-containing protein [Phycisphaerales bacterium]